jgi:hypothetical protein
MAHYALIDPETMTVVSVFVGRDEDDLADGVTDWEQYYAPNGIICRRTSYNTHGGAHTSDGTPFRNNYAGIGYLWDEQRDAFIPPKPYPSWLLEEDTCLWQPPTPRPTEDGMYAWNEDTQTWEPLND